MEEEKRNKEVGEPWKEKDRAKRRRTTERDSPFRATVHLVVYKGPQEKMAEGKISPSFLNPFLFFLVCINTVNIISSLIPQMAN